MTCLIEESTAYAILTSRFAVAVFGRQPTLSAAVHFQRQLLPRKGILPAISTECARYWASSTSIEIA